MIKDHYDYVGLIERFLNREITVKEFERTYIDEFTSEKTPLGGDLFTWLDWLFAEVDSYTDLPIGPEDDPAFTIDEDQLRESAVKVLKEIRALK